MIVLRYSPERVLSRIGFLYARCKNAPMDKWSDYKLILALHRAGTIRGAAEAIGVNHATVSRRLVQINQTYDGQIFDRTSEGYKATPLGLELVNAAKKIETISFEADRKSRATRAELAGPIRLSVGEPIAQYLLSDELARFANENEDIALTVETSIDLVNLDRSDADVVIRGTQNPPDHLVGRRLFAFYLCEYCSRDYLQNTAQADRRWLRYSKSLTSSDWIASTQFPTAPVSLKSDDIVWLHKAAVQGHGMIKSACYMADPEPGLMRLPGAVPTKAQDLWVLTHPDLTSAPRIKYFMRYLVDALNLKRELIQGRAL